MLKEHILQWCRDHLKVGERPIFKEMEETKNRIREEARQSREEARGHRH